MCPVYTFLLYAITPFVVLRWLLRSIKLSEYRQRLNERFGFYTAKFLTEGAWFHAVSVGEAESLFPLVREVKKRYPELPILITTTTPTGSARVKAVFGDSVQHVYLPYDLLGNVQRFIRAFKPKMGVIVETEIWPNLFLHCQEQNIPLAIINARMSERSLRGYLRLKFFIEKILASVKVVAAQSEEDAKRFLAFGLDHRCVEVTGNLKFDLQVDNDLSANANVLRRQLFAGRPVWIAASTHEGEEEQVLNAFSMIIEDVPEAVLILVPRHPERFTRVAGLCNEKGYSVVTRTQGDSVEFGAEVFLLDTMGELRLFYAASDVAFVGGSLVPVGGHNLLESAAVAVPTIFGKYMQNFDAISKLLLSEKAAVQIEDAIELAKTVTTLLGDPVMRKNMGRAGQQAVQNNRGAMARTLDLLSYYFK